MIPFVIIQPHLRYGGAERQTVLVANRMVSLGRPVTIILHSRDGGLIDDLDPRVDLIDLGLSGHASIPLLIPRMRAVLRGLAPSYVIVKLWSSILAVAFSEASAPQHVYNYCEDLDPTDHAEYIRMGRVKQALIRQIFLRKTEITANTSTVRDLMVAKYGLSVIPDVIPSTVSSAEVRARAVEVPPDMVREEGRPVVLSVGSLIERKGLRVTLGALERLSMPVDWHVVGDGPLKPELENYVDSSERLRVFVHSGTANPYPYMAHADVLIHSAASEAWGIVLLESLAVGTPVIAADAIGPSEMFARLGSGGGLMRLYSRNDEAALLEELLKFLSSQMTTADDGAAFVAPFDLDSAVALWVERAERSRLGESVRR